MRSPAIVAALAAAAALDALRAALTLAAPDERAVIARLIDEAKACVASACAAAGVHPSARADVEVVRPSSTPREGA